MTDSDEIPPAGPDAPDGASSPVPGQAPLPLAPRTYPATVGPRHETAAPGSKLSLEEFVSWLGRVNLEEDPSAEEAAVEEPHQSRETRKFRRTETAAAKTARESAARAQAESAAAGGAATQELPDEWTSTEGGSPRTGDSAIIAELTPRGEWRSNSTRASFLSSLPAQCVVVVLMGLCYVLGRMTLPTRAAAPPQQAGPVTGGKDLGTVHDVPEQVMAVLDQAMAAQNAGEMGKAFKQLEQLRSSGKDVSGLDFELGWLAYRQGDYPAALLALNRSIAEGEQVGASYDLRGLIAGERRPGVVDDFEAAAQASPFEATAFFHWGEALRRRGKPRQALLRLQQALDRAQSPAAQALFGLKIRLTQLELGEEKDFAPALAAALGRPQPATEWLLTAAAQEMHSGNYRAAAAHLEQAQHIGSPVALGTALQDYFFQVYADKPELAGVYAQILGPAALTTPAPTVAPTGMPAVAVPAPIIVPATNRGSK